MDIIAWENVGSSPDEIVDLVLATFRQVEIVESEEIDPTTNKVAKIGW